MSRPEEANVALDSRSLAESLEPKLAEACDDRLAKLVWFRTDWQRGGAATGTSTWRLDDGTQTPVVVKLPVGQRELVWTRRLQRPDDPDPVAPRLYAAGVSVGEYDLGWLVIERFEHGPLGLRWHEDHLSRIADAIARFHAATAGYPVDQPGREEPWEELLAEARERARTSGMPDRARWTAALKRMSMRLDEIVDEWNLRPVQEWLHGDAHIANAMSRHALDEGAVSLIDLAEVHAGHWIEDAVYLERQLWVAPERMKLTRPVKAVAEARKRLGLAVEPDYPRLALIRRLLLAATAPRFIKTEGHPRHLEACLNRLEQGLTEV